MRILFFCPQPLWPTNTGARLRNFHLANELAKVHSVIVLQLFPSDTDLEKPINTPFKEVISISRKAGYPLSRTVRGLMGPEPVPVLRFYSDEANRILSELINRDCVDAVQLEGVHLFQYLETIDNAPRRLPIVLDWHNIESEVVRRFASHSPNVFKKIAGFRTAQLLRVTERKLLERSFVHTVVSEREKQELQQWSPDADVRVIDNGVDTSRFGPEALQPFKSALSETLPTLLFVGSMDYHANIEAVIWFVKTIWPEISSQFPDLHFTIVGREPAPKVQALANNRVHVTGTVPDVRKQYANAFAVVVPLRIGGGTRLKILEAMAAGVPVISTTLGAEGIAGTDEQHLLIADTPNGFASAVNRLLNSDDLRLKLIRNARALVMEKYDWTALGATLLSIYSQLEVCLPR